MGRIFTVVRTRAREDDACRAARRARVEQLCVGVEQRWQGLRSVTPSPHAAGAQRLTQLNQSHGRKKRSQTRINFLHISTTRKNVRTEFLASSKWPTQAEWMDRHIQERWDAGRPVTLGELAAPCVRYVH